MPHDLTVYGPGVQPRTRGVPDGNLDNFLDNWPHYKDRLILFLGAGSSIGAVCNSGQALPTATGLRDELWREFMLSDEDREKPFNLSLLSLEHTAALIEAKVGRGPLVEYVGRRFTVTRPLWPHAALPFLKPKAIYTTNYDELIELGWQSHPTLPRISPIFAPKPLTDGFTPLYKPHGTAQHAKAKIGDGGIVLTQFDYFEMLESKRKMLKSFLELMDDNCVVFIGYSFQDMDIASMLYEMRARNRDRHWYAVFPRHDSNVRSMYDTRYAIRQIARTFADFIAEVGFSLRLIPNGWNSELPSSPDSLSS